MIRLRTLAVRLCRCAVRLTPPPARDWADAMAREVDEIDDDRAAVSWAWGAFTACLGERIRSMAILMTLLRLGLAGLCALFALGTALPAAMLLAYRTGATRWLEALAGAMPGDDYHRFIPLLDALPGWQLPAALVTIALYGVAGLLILFRRKAAAWALAVCLALAVASLAANHANPVFQHVFSPQELRSDYVGLAMKAVVAAAAAWAVRPRRDERLV